MKNLEEIRIDWRSEKSIKAGEQKKSRLENAGYRLIREIPGLQLSGLVYQKGDRC